MANRRHHPRSLSMVHFSQRLRVRRQEHVSRHQWHHAITFMVPLLNQASKWCRQLEHHDRNGPM
jgi:hypothetical protein